ncbi:MAG TPA: zf-HC2 domain-containing protein [Vicinamibacteria bacterium]|nr:zf-HC2 domain-containing protein [Vicinamibacteria bacterium]
MTCDPEKVTAFVDEALPEDERKGVEAHLAECLSCREQADFETVLRARLRALAPLEVPAGLGRSVRRRLRSSSARRVIAAVALPAAAALALFVFWLRAAPPFVAWELARDHSSCFGRSRLPAKVWSGDPDRVSAWFDDDGFSIPVVPEKAGSAELLGARYCPLIDRSVAHLYYSGDDVNLSLFVVPGSVRMGASHQAEVLGQTVHLLRVGGTVVGVVSASEEAVEAAERALTRTVARLAPAR